MEKRNAVRSTIRNDGKEISRGITAAHCVYSPKEDQQNGVLRQTR